MGHCRSRRRTTTHTLVFQKVASLLALASTKIDNSFIGDLRTNGEKCPSLVSVTSGRTKHPAAKCEKGKFPLQNEIV